MKQANMLSRISATQTKHKTMANKTKCYKGGAEINLESSLAANDATKLVQTKCVSGV